MKALKLSRTFATTSADGAKDSWWLCLGVPNYLTQLPEQAFHQWYAQRQNNDYGLGAVQFVAIETDVWVANMIGQHKIKVKGDDGAAPVRYEAIERALIQVGDKAVQLQASVHMPRIGCGLAGGEWDRIEPLLIRHLCARDVEVVVYDWN